MARMASRPHYSVTGSLDGFLLVEQRLFLNALPWSLIECMIDSGDSRTRNEQIQRFNIRQLHETTGTEPERMAKMVVSFHVKSTFG